MRAPRSLRRNTQLRRDRLSRIARFCYPICYPGRSLSRRTLYTSLKRLATPAGLEPATSRLEGECSIQLSYGVASCAGRGHPRRLIAPASRCGNCFGRLGGPAAWPSGAHAVVAEIIGVAFHFRGALMRLNDRVLHSVLVGEGDRLLDRLEPQLHLV